MDGDYYSDYYSGKFLYQQRLTEKIQYPDLFIKESGATPLTTCLLIANEALINLQTEITKCNGKLTSIQENINSIKQVNKNLNFGDFSTLDYDSGHSGSALKVRMIAVPVNNVGAASSFDDTLINFNFQFDNGYLVPKNNDSKFREIVGRINLFTFYAVFYTILDCYSQQVKKFFSLETDDINWGKLISQVKYLPPSFMIGRISRKFDIDTAQKRVSKYRNRFVHDGHCRMLSKVTENYQWKIYLQKEPKIIESPYSYDVLKECPVAFLELIDFLDKSYKILLEKIEVDGQPPWKLE